MPTDINHAASSGYENLIDVNTGNELVINADGSLNTKSSEIAVGTAVVSRIAVTNTVATTLSVSNAAKRQVIIYNEGGTLFIKFGVTASVTDYTYVMNVDTVLVITGYYGLITARKNSGSTFVQVTEVGI